MAVISVERDDILSQIKTATTISDDRLDIAETALLLASLDLPKNNLSYYREKLNKMVLDLGAVARDLSHVSDMAAAVSEILFGLHGYSGDTQSFDDVQNANLMRVIDRRKGLPVALGILVIHMVRAQGWLITGVNFPGHFLLRLTREGEQVVMDPFENARPLTAKHIQNLVTQIQGPNARLEPHYLKSVCDRDILVRLQNNIKSRALQADEPDRAIEVLETMCMIAPSNVAVALEMAVLESDTGNFKRALGRLSSFLECQEGHPDEAQVVNLIEILKRRVN